MWRSAGWHLQCPSGWVQGAVPVLPLWHRFTSAYAYVYIIIMDNTLACQLSKYVEFGELWGSWRNFTSCMGHNLIHEALNVYHRLLWFRFYFIFFFSSVFKGQENSLFFLAARFMEWAVPPSVWSMIKNIRRMLYHTGKDEHTFIPLTMHRSDVTGKYILVFVIGYKNRGKSLFSQKIHLNRACC